MLPQPQQCEFGKSVNFRLKTQISKKMEILLTWIFENFFKNRKTNHKSFWSFNVSWPPLRKIRKIELSSICREIHDFETPVLV